MQCVTFIGNPFWLTYQVVETETYPNCSEFWLTDTAPATGTGGNSNGEVIMTTGITPDIMVTAAESIMLAFAIAVVYKMILRQLWNR